MTVDVFAAPLPVQIRPNTRPGFTHVFTGWDGQVWPLSDPDAGVFLTDQGLRGVDLPATADHTDELAGIDGQVLRGWRTPARDVLWPLLVWSDISSRRWRQLDSALWRSLAPGRVGTWRVTDPDGEWRELRVRCTSSDGVVARDPSRLGWHAYALTLVADDPMWTGPEVPPSVAGGQQDAAFIDPTGSPPFWISGGTDLSGAHVTNPGDVPAWPTWEATGPHHDLVVGIGARTIECPPVPAGSTLVIDTSPWSRTALLDGADVTDQLGVTDFAPVPPGEQVQLVASSAGSGRLACRLRPRYLRAW